ncbi:MAG: hypothetical protein QM536_02350 [Chitinophagaceae bacterium]|nr:hypothetical protein [Chitinophagaceae bacterium]
MLVILVFSACDYNLVCPAYQSSYLLKQYPTTSLKSTSKYMEIICDSCKTLFKTKNSLDYHYSDKHQHLYEQIRYERFSLFGPNYTPLKKYNVEKNTYGLLKKKSKKHKNKTINIVKKQNQFFPSIENKDTVTTSIIPDSLVSSNIHFKHDSSKISKKDSIRFMTIDKKSYPKYSFDYNSIKYSYNEDQFYYNKFFGELFVSKRIYSENNKTQKNDTVNTTLDEFDSLNFSSENFFDTQISKYDSIK